MDEHFRSAIRAIATRYDFAAHPYFRWMEGTTRLEFAGAQAPFLYAVEEFPCALAACLSKLGNLEVRSDLAGNVAVEHGMGKPSQTHKQTFLT